MVDLFYYKLDEEILAEKNVLGNVEEEEDKKDDKAKWDEHAEEEGAVEDEQWV